MKARVREVTLSPFGSGPGRGPESELSGVESGGILQCFRAGKEKAKALPLLPLHQSTQFPDFRAHSQPSRPFWRASPAFCSLWPFGFVIGQIAHSWILPGVLSIWALSSLPPPPPLFSEQEEGGRGQLQYELGGLPSSCSPPPKIL